MHTKASTGYRIYYNSDLSGIARLDTPDGQKIEFPAEIIKWIGTEYSLSKLEEFIDSCDSNEQ